MWTPRRIIAWAADSNAAAVANARAASTECSRRRVERADVELYLAARLAASSPRAQGVATPRAASH